MTENDLKLAKSFHGHLGPFLALGMVMGSHALAALKARKHFGVHVIVHCSPKPPMSCIVDGLQLSTGATYGKRNIDLVPSEQIMVEVCNTDTGERLCMMVKESAVERMQGWLNEAGDEGAARIVLSHSDELFEVVKE